MLDRLAAIGERVARWRRLQDREAEEARGSRLPRLIDAALDNLREAAAKKIQSDADAEARIVEILARAATDLRRN